MCRGLGIGTPAGFPHPASRCHGCTHLRAGRAGGTLGTGSAGIALLPGFSLFTFGPRLPIGALRGSGHRQRVEPPPELALGPCRGNGAKYSPGDQQSRRDRGHRAPRAHPVGER